MPELITLCKGCNSQLDHGDIEFWKRPDSGGVEKGHCRMCWALGTPEEFLDTLLSPEERIMYNKHIKGGENDGRNTRNG